MRTSTGQPSRFKPGDKLTPKKGEKRAGEVAIVSHYDWQGMVWVEFEDGGRDDYGEGQLLEASPG